MNITTTQELSDRLERSWQALRARLDKLSADDLERRLADGRTVKQAVAEVAFWNETCAPVFAWLRGQPEVPVGEWYGGSELGLEPGEPWPKDEVHRAREADWADSVSARAVLDRLETAHRKAITTVATLSADEWRLDDGLIAKAQDCTYAQYDELIDQMDG